MNANGRAEIERIHEGRWLVVADSATYHLKCYVSGPEEKALAVARVMDQGIERLYAELARCALGPPAG